MLMIIGIAVAAWVLIGIPAGWLVGGMIALRDHHEAPRYRRTPNN